MMRTIFASLIASFALAAAACGGPGSSTPADSHPTAYKDMDHKQRAQFMKDVVLPKSKELFVAFDPKFKDMDCKTCHGDGVDTGKFEMPNPKIRPLPNSEEAFMAMMGKEPDLGKWAKFMSEQLEPMMTQALGMQPYDPKTKTGEFGCTGCHTLVNADGSPAPLPPHQHDHHDHDADHHDDAH